MLKAIHITRFIRENPGRIYRLLTLILVCGAVLWTAWDLFYKLGTAYPPAKHPSPSRQSTPAKASIVPPPPVQPLEAYLSIKDKNPFGLASADGGAQKTAGLPPPPPLELVGTIAFGDQGGFAVLREAGQNAKKVYKIGDSVSGGRILIQVSRNMVVLKKGEATETLHARTLPLQSLALQQGGSPIQEKLVARNEVMKSLGNVIDEHLIRPHFTEGKMDGFVIGKVSAGSPLKSAGFESGDLLQGINGKTVKTPDDVFLLKSLKRDSSGKVTFSIQRNGRSMVLNAS